MTQKLTYKELEKQFHKLEQESEKRKLAEEALKQKINELNSFINNIPDMAWLKDKDSHFIAANKAFCNAAGMDEEFLLNQSCEVCFGKEAARKFIEDDQMVMKGKKQVIIEEKIIDAQKNEVWLETIKSPILNDKGQPVGTVGIARNITERRKAEKENIKLQEQLRQAQKLEAIGTLAGGISHDFNNILAIIIGNIELAFDNIPSGSLAYKNLKQAEKACRRARDIVRQILSFSRQQMILNQEPVKISEVIKESLKLFKSSIPATIEIRQDIGCESDMVMAEPTQINKVLTNLCTNAYHAMYDKGGILEVRLEKKNFNPGDRFPCPDMNPGSYLLLTVGDTGCGMDHDTIERIFDPYFTTKQVGKGSGMGLAVVHGIVANHQGFIAVESEPGKGSVFKIYLPVNYA